jgi:hypothetical protein
MLPSCTITHDQEEDESFLLNEGAEEDTLCISDSASDLISEDDNSDDDEYREKSGRILKKNQDKTLKKERKQLVKQERQDRLKSKRRLKRESRSYLWKRGKNKNGTTLIFRDVRIYYYLGIIIFF